MKACYGLIFIAFMLTAGVYAQPPAGYYSSAAGLAGTPLQAALHDIIDNHTSVSYNNLYTYFAVTDIKPDNTVWDMYSDIPGGTPPYTYYYIAADECGNYAQEGDCFNREHSWPKSWFGGEVMPMYSDLFHLYPTDGWVNNERGNYPYGKVGNATWTSMNGSKLGSCSWPGYSGTVFEPVDGYKGDFARSYFYMSVRYYGEDSGWPGSDETTGAQLKPWALAMMLQWNTQDPVSQKEINRNNHVYAIQGNRNPFIDYPQYAHDIWETGMGTGDYDPSAFILRAFPNPAETVAKLEIPSIISQNSLSFILRSTTGMQVKSTTCREGRTLVIDLQGLAPGVYFFTLTGKDQAGVYHGALVRE